MSLRDPQSRPGLQEQQQLLRRERARSRTGRSGVEAEGGVAAVSAPDRLVRTRAWHAVSSSGHEPPPPPRRRRHCRHAPRPPMRHAPCPIPHARPPLQYDGVFMRICRPGARGDSVESGSSIEMLLQKLLFRPPLVTLRARMIMLPSHC